VSITYGLMLALLLVAGGLCLWGYLTGGPGPVRPQAPAPDERPPAAHGEETRRLHGRPMRSSEEWTPPWERPAGPPQMPPDWRTNRGK
jgi:hypothetical protein